MGGIGWIQGLYLQRSPEVLLRENRKERFRLDSQVLRHEVYTFMKERVEAPLLSQMNNKFTRAEKTQWGELIFGLEELFLIKIVLSLHASLKQLDTSFSKTKTKNYKKWSYKNKQDEYKCCNICNIVLKNNHKKTNKNCYPIIGSPRMVLIHI